MPHSSGVTASASIRATTRQLHGPTTQTESGERLNHPAPPQRPIEDQSAMHKDDLHPIYLPTNACVPCEHEA